MTRRALAWMDAQGWPWILVVLTVIGTAGPLADWLVMP